MLENSYFQLKNTINNSTHNASYNRECHNWYRLVDNLRNKISIQIDQLNPLFSKRSKRGLINGLGSILKSITGNLDQEDAERYDKVVTLLSNNQDKIKSIVKDQITLLQTSIMKFKESTEALAHNQKILRIKISQIDYAIRNTTLQNIELYHYFLLQTLFSQFISAFQIIYDIFDRLEVAITFSKLNTFHNSIIEPQDLLSEIISISNNLNSNKLPFEPKIKNILLFEKVMEIKSYSKGNQIIFILEIPIVENENYNYYHLYSLPIPMSGSFKTIIPHSKFLLLNEQTYAFSSIKCQEVQSEEYICQESNMAKLVNNVPCEVQLLRYSSNITSCEYTPVNLETTKVQKIEENKWIVVTPEAIVVQQKCGNNNDNIPLKGNYVIEISNQCEVRINDIVIKTFQNILPNFKNIQLPHIQLINKDFKSNINIDNKPLELKSINLDDIKNIYRTLDNQKTQVDSLEEIPIINLDRTSFYTILLYILLLIITIYMFIQYCYKKNKISRNIIESANKPVTANNIELSNSGL